MCACEVGRFLATVVVVTGAAVSEAAADPGRLDLLAAEASRVAAAGPGATGPASWGVLGVFLLGTMAAAFAGTWLGARRVAQAGGRNGWRELTYRFRSGTPLRLKTETLQRLSGVLGELEEIGSDLRKRRDGEPAAPEEERSGASAGTDSGDPPAVTFRRRAPLAAPPAFPRREPAEAAAPQATEPAPARPRERRAAYERARQLLREGADPGVVREITGLKSAEVDLLRAAPGTGLPAPGIRRRGAHLNVSAGRSAGSAGER